MAFERDWNIQVKAAKTRDLHPGPSGAKALMELAKRQSHCIEAHLEAKRDESVDVPHALKRILLPRTELG